MDYAVKVEDFSYSYPDGIEALRAIRLEVQDGQKVGIIGPNGSGKTTLLRAIAGFIRGKGVITINGLELCSQNLRQIRSVMGCYMGNPDDYLSMPTVYEDVILGPLERNLDVDTVRRNVDSVLQQMNLVTLIKKATASLSEGQKRSAAMAAVFSVRPKILLLDEPDIGLDPHKYNNLVQVFRELPQTMIISTCHLAFAAAVADRVIVLDEGQITADGTPAEILNNEKLLAAHGLV